MPRVYLLQRKLEPPDPDFHAHSIALTRGNVVAVFGSQNVSDSNRDIQLFGECRDTTTTRDTKGAVESVTLA